MSASPALWTARAILAGALAVGVALVAVRRSPAPNLPVVPPRPVAAPARPAGAGYPVPGNGSAAAEPPAPDPNRTLQPKPQPQAYAIRRILDTGGPIPYGRWFWDEAGVPPGRVVITVDLKAGVLSIFRGGYEIGTAAVIYGADELPTPLGRFPILGKEAHHRSHAYGEAPMPYSLWLTRTGVAIHGSDRMTYQGATHGCIGLPLAFARRLFDAASVGDEVIVTRGENLTLGQPIKAA